MTDQTQLAIFDQSLVGAQADNRGIAYREGDVYVYRASATGSCVRALVASMLGYEEGRYAATQEMLENAAGQGDLLEGHVLERLVEMGYHITQRQLTVEVPVLENVIVRGHTDGMTAGDDGLAGIEVKTMSKDRYAKWLSSGRDLRAGGEFAKYGYQLATYWRGLNQMYDDKVGRYVYAAIDRNSGQVDVSVLTEPPVPWRAVRQKVMQSHRWVAKGALPPCDITEGAERYFCPFVFLHDEEDVEGEMVLGDETLVLVQGLAQRYVELSTTIKAGKQAEEERKPIGRELTTLVPRKSKVRAGRYTVTGSGGSTKGMDWAKLASDLGLTVDEVKEKYQRSFEFEYPLVKIAKER